MLVLLLASGATLGSNILVDPSSEMRMDTIGVNVPIGWLTSEVLYPGSAARDWNSNSGNRRVSLCWR